MYSFNNYSTLVKAIIFIAFFNFISFGCDSLSLKDEPSCSGGAMWEITTEVDSLNYTTGYLSKESEYFIFAQDQETEGFSAIQVNIFSKEIKSSNRNATSQISFFPSAYASPGPTFKSNDTIKSINITSSFDYEGIKMGDNLSTLFQFVPSHSNKMYKITDVLNNQKEIQLINGYEESHFWIVAKEGKVFPNDLTITITLANGKYFKKLISID